MQTLRAVSWKVNRPGHSDILCAKWKVIGESRWWNLSRSAIADLWFFLRVLSRLIKLFKLKAVKIKQKSIWFGHVIISLPSLQEATSSTSPVLMLPMIRYPRTARPSLPSISFSKINLFLKIRFDPCRSEPCMHIWNLPQVESGSLTCQNMNILAWRPPSIITYLRQTQKCAYQDELVDDDALLNATIGDCRQREDLHGAAFYCVALLWRSVAVQAEG